MVHTLLYLYGTLMRENRTARFITYEMLTKSFRPLGRPVMLYNDTTA